MYIYISLSLSLCVCVFVTHIYTCICMQIYQLFTSCAYTHIDQDRLEATILLSAARILQSWWRQRVRMRLNQHSNYALRILLARDVTEASIRQGCLRDMLDAQAIWHTFMPS